MALAFGYAGLMTSEGVNVSLLLGAVSFLVGIFGGLVWILSPEKAAQGAADRSSRVIGRGTMTSSEWQLSLLAAVLAGLLSPASPGRSGQ